jgi:hypothetical protein
MVPEHRSSAETAHPLRGGVAKPRVFPQREDCRVTEQSPVQEPARSLRVDGYQESLAVKRVWRRQACHAQAHNPVTAIETKGEA